MVHVAAECWPFARTGGLGEAVAGLVRQQRALGLRAWVLLPLYDTVRRAIEANGYALEQVGSACAVVAGGGNPLTVRFVRARRAPGEDGGAGDAGWDRLCRYARFVECDAAFARGGIYGVDGTDFGDNAWRFAVLAQAALEWVRRIRRSAHAPDVVLHSHDWHAALAPLYLHARAPDDPELLDVASVLTVHNASYQGHFPPDTLHHLGLPPELYDWRFAEWYGRVNLLKGALAVVDGVTTVSPTHAAELRTSLGGFGLHQSFAALGERLVGIRNGIDRDTWDPQHPAGVASAYHEADLSGKARSKAALQRRLGLEERGDVPLVALCSRLCVQKGIDLLLEARVGDRLDLQLVLLGEGEPRLVEALRALAGRYPTRVAFETPFTDDGERELLAGADLLLMPSQFEPCGLAQLRAQRFGVVPVAHAVGGLRDTIRDSETGFLFSPFQVAGLQAALDRALWAFHDRATWHVLVRSCMGANVGWLEPAIAYRRVYADAATARRSTT